MAGVAQGGNVTIGEMSSAPRRPQPRGTPVAGSSARPLRAANTTAFDFSMPVDQRTVADAADLVGRSGRAAASAAPSAMVAATLCQGVVERGADGRRQVRPSRAAARRSCDRRAARRTTAGSARAGRRVELAAGDAELVGRRRRSRPTTPAPWRTAWRGVDRRGRRRTVVSAGDDGDGGERRARARRPARRRRAHALRASVPRYSSMTLGSPSSSRPVPV